MKRYRFPLEAVLRARRAQEDVARQNLVGANHRVRQAQENLSRQQARYLAVADPVGVVDAVTAVQDHAGRQVLAGVVDEAKRGYEDRSVEAAVLQAAWREAAQRVAALERLDERRRADHSLLALRAELVEVDDLVTSRFEPSAVMEEYRWEIPAAGSATMSPDRQNLAGWSGPDMAAARDLSGGER